MTTKQRLERLERESRWMRRVGAVAVAVAATVFLIGQGKDKQLPDLEVRSLTVKDKDGKVRVLLGVAPDGSAGLRFMKDGGPRARFGFLPDGSPGMSLYKKGGDPRARFCIAPDGSLMLGLADKDGTLRVVLGTMSDGSTSMGLADKGGRLRVLLGERGGSTSMGLTDKDGKPRVALETAADGSPSLQLLDAKGKVIWKAPSGRRRSPVEAAVAQCKELHDKAMLWKIINRKPPDSLDEMMAPLRKGDDENFLESVPDDPWGHPYVLKRKGMTIRIYSWGEDGKESTDDDIVYPDK
ncbi:MAG: type II secretion system protein GspG [Planctomycetota bacterium]|jgi:hypothetical protein